MNLFCKRGLCLLLMLILTAGLLSGLTVGASAVTVEERQAAVIATAWAYFDKGHSVQYDGDNICDVIARDDGGKTRSTNQTAPEGATPHETMFTVCSDFAHQIYYETFRYQVNGNPGACITRRLRVLTKDNPIVVWAISWMNDKNKTDQDYEKALNEMFAIAQPGDIYTSGGHAMVWAGDLTGDGRPDLIESGGRHMRSGIKKGKADHREYKNENDPDIDPRYEAVFIPSGNGGSIHINDAVDYITKYYMKKPQQTLIRPTLEMKPDDYINPAALYRVSHPRLAIDRMLNKTRFNSAYPGETVTMTLKLSNFSDKTYTVPVTEKTPAGAKIKTPFAGASVSGDTQTWNVELKPNEPQTFTCEYEITAPFGGEVVFEGGSVGDIPSNSIPIQVGGAKLNADDAAKLAKVAAGEYDKLLKDEKADNATMADVVYQKILGLNVRIPDYGTVIRKFTKPTFTERKVKPTHVFLQKDEVKAEDRTEYRMMVPHFWDGTRMWNEFGWQRCSDPRDMHVEPGDVIVRSGSYMDASKSEQMVYLGGGKYLTCKEGSYPIVEEPEFVMCLRSQVFYVLRPTLAYEDVHKLPALTPVEKKPLKFTDVKESDWFYTYVKDLVDRGTVSGMTETAFDPNGNLTYGQALKLLAEAIGEKTPAKSGSHWASGYMTLAKEKKWIDGDVDPDKAITRVAFCRIAVKARRITAEIVKNPFTDTEDKAVLILNKVGIINGMTDTTFLPNGKLTRAQISKIIWNLIAL